MQKVTLRAFKFENVDIKKFKNDVFENISKILNEGCSVSTRKMFLNQDDPKKENDSLSYYEFVNNNNHLVATILRSSEENTLPTIESSLFDEPLFNILDLKKTSIDTGIIYKDHFYIALSENYLVTNLKSSLSPKRIQTYINYLTNTSCCSLTPVLEKRKNISFAEIKTITLNDGSLNISEPRVKNKNIKNEESKKSLFLKPYEIIKFLKERLSYNNEVKMLSDKDIAEMVSVQLVLEFHKPKDISMEEYMERMAELTLKYIDDPSDVIVKGEKNKKLNGKELLKTKIVEIEKTDEGDIIEQDLYQEMTKFLIELENEKTI